MGDDLFADRAKFAFYSGGDRDSPEIIVANSGFISGRDGRVL